MKGLGLCGSTRRPLIQAGCPEKVTPGLSPEERGVERGRASLRREGQVQSWPPRRLWDMTEAASKPLWLKIGFQKPKTRLEGRLRRGGAGW